MIHNVFFIGAKSKLFPQYREKSLQGFFAFKLKVSSTGKKSLKGIFRSNSKSLKIPIGIFVFKLKVISYRDFGISLCGFFGSKSPVQVENPYSDYFTQTQSLQYRDLRKSLYGFFRSNSKSPVQGFWKGPIGIFSFKIKVFSTGISGNPYRDFS